MLRLVHSSAQDGQQGSLDDEALNWVVRLTSGEVTEDDREAFRRWRDQSPEHREALARARTLWTQVGRALPSPARPRTRRTLAGVGIKMAAAASLLLCLGLGQNYLSVGRFDEVTAKGERRMFRLPDGSRMLLAGDTAVNLRFADGVRRIDLVRGQALFAVRHDDRHPFVVHAGGSTIRDVGTTFDVQRRDDRTRVAVVEGVVEASMDDKRVLLRATQSFSVSADAPAHFGTADVSTETAWTRGRLLFQNRPLGEIVSELRPHYRGRIFVLGQTAANRRLSAAIDLRRIDDWLTGVASTQSVSIHRIGDVVVLS